VNKIAVLIIILAGLLWAAGARAEGWEARLSGHSSLPTKFLVIDKDQQKFMIFGKKSPLTVLERLTCATGQNPGDKLEQGDMKTPEGIYFIGRRLNRGLDYELYGNLAYTLNFPNPVDRIKGKTGSGIWIHGRGSPIQPRETKGCVALFVADLERLEDSLSPGMPVAIAKSVTWNEKVVEDEAEKLTAMVRDWAASWEARENVFFSYYDAHKFSKSWGKSFTHFQRRKERIFQGTEWIQLMIHNVRVLSGPDYWVTYFDQYYRTPTLISQGIKRLYWQKDENGELRIVGREWRRSPVTLDRAYLDHVGSEVSPLVEDWRKAWLETDLEAYKAFYASDASQNDRWGIQEITEHKKDVWSRSEPQSIGIGSLELELDPRGIRATFEQRYRADNGYSDHGMKTLVLAPHGNSWKIVAEEWRPI
jgi:murein L,D-transpeptidase YafK